MKNAVIYIHGKGGNSAEAGHYNSLFFGYEVIGFDYRAQTPWEAKKEFTEFFSEAGRKYESVILIANSIGAFFTMNADINGKIKKAYFISPIVDMEKLISDMLTWSGIGEDELCREGELEASSGEVLSWEYLCYVREHPLNWTLPTHIIYGENDELTSFETISAFAAKTGATLDTMAGGEHWFHTPEQMDFIDSVIKQNEP